MLPEVLIGDGFRGLERRPHIRDVRIVRGLKQWARRTHRVDCNKMMGAMAMPRVSVSLRKTDK